MYNLIKCNNEAKFIDAICKTIVEQASIHIKQKDSFSLVLSGGKTPKLIFDNLALYYKNKIDWGKVDFFWLDERCVNPSHVDSNYRLAYEYLISRLEKVGTIYRIKGELSPSSAAKEYERDILKYFQNKNILFDLILIGMGEDGHCASLFPESSELNKSKKLVVATKNEYNGHKRVTLTFPIINKCDKVLMINSQEKYDVYNDLQKALPIHFVNRENMKIIFKKD